MNKIFLRLILFLVIALLGSVQLFAGQVVWAQCDSATGTLANGELCRLENPLQKCVKDSNGREVCSDVTEVPALINTVVKAALGVIGAFTLLMFVWGGFQWLTSAGNPEKVSSGTQTMIWAVIGVVLVLSSYILLSTFFGFLAP